MIVITLITSIVGVNSARKKSISEFTCDKLLGVVMIITLITFIVGVNSASQKWFQDSHVTRSGEVNSKYMGPTSCGGTG